MIHLVNPWWHITMFVCCHVDIKLPLLDWASDGDLCNRKKYCFCAIHDNYHLTNDLIALAAHLNLLIYIWNIELISTLNEQEEFHCLWAHKTSLMQPLEYSAFSRKNYCFLLLQHNKFDCMLQKVIRSNTIEDKDTNQEDVSILIP